MCVPWAYTYRRARAITGMKPRGKGEEKRHDICAAWFRVRVHAQVIPLLLSARRVTLQAGLTGFRTALHWFEYGRSLE